VVVPLALEQSEQIELELLLEAARFKPELPGNTELQVIVCRNVLNSFDTPLRHRVTGRSCVPFVPDERLFRRAA
jgi:hypothetical protein